MRAGLFGWCHVNDLHLSMFLCTLAIEGGELLGLLGGDTTPCFLTVACSFAGCESVILYLIVDDIGMPHSWTAALPSNECQEEQLSNTGLGQWMQNDGCTYLLAVAPV